MVLKSSSSLLLTALLLVFWVVQATFSSAARAQVQPTEKPVVAQKQPAPAPEEAVKTLPETEGAENVDENAARPVPQSTKDANALKKTVTQANLGQGWTAQCNSAGDDLKCRALINVFTPKDNQLIFAVSVQIAEAGGAAALFTMPLGLYLPAGLKLKLDDGPEHEAIIQTCDQRGCYAGWVMQKDEVEQMVAGKQLAASFQANNRSPINITLPLSGFEKVFAKLD
ncbi:MAG: invasion associated locus B family protein [Stappiaceae bacterium]